MYLSPLVGCHLCWGAAERSGTYHPHHNLSRPGGCSLPHVWSGPTSSHGAAPNSTCCCIRKHWGCTARSGASSTEKLAS
eukprot:4920145-Prymnesium_polylepis.1